jgi:hypothetical protein
MIRGCNEVGNAIDGVIATINTMLAVFYADPGSPISQTRRVLLVRCRARPA